MQKTRHRDFAEPKGAATTALALDHQGGFLVGLRQVGLTPEVGRKSRCKALKSPISRKEMAASELGDSGKHFPREDSPREAPFSPATGSLGGAFVNRSLARFGLR
jgi:hypothetical protein